MQRYDSELPPQPPIQFPKCHVAKAMANSVKLTKNLPLARNNLSLWTRSISGKRERSVSTAEVQALVDSPIRVSVEVEDKAIMDDRCGWALLLMSVLSLFN